MANTFNIFIMYLVKIIGFIILLLKINHLMVIIIICYRINYNIKYLPILIVWDVIYI